MKRYRCQGIRNPKTDKIDALIIAQYGIDFRYRFKDETKKDSKRTELRFLGKQYEQYMKFRVMRCQAISDILDRTMPGVYKILNDFDRNNVSDKLADFAYDFFHKDQITKSSEKVFIKKYQNWLKKKGYHQNEDEACQLYSPSLISIPTLDETPVTRMLVKEAVNVLKEVDFSLFHILNEMKSLAKCMPEYETVLSMSGVGETPGPRLIAEIGNPRLFHSGKALLAYAGPDAPPYQSGQFTGTKRHISKRGSSTLRKIGYELMDVVNKHQRQPNEDSVCKFFMKKRKEGKPYRVAMIAAYNKLSRLSFKTVVIYGVFIMP